MRLRLVFTACLLCTVVERMSTCCVYCYANVERRNSLQYLVNYLCRLWPTCSHGYVKLHDFSDISDGGLIFASQLITFGITIANLRTLTSYIFPLLHDPPCNTATMFYCHCRMICRHVTYVNKSITSNCQQIFITFKIFHNKMSKTSKGNIKRCSQTV